MGKRLIAIMIGSTMALTTLAMTPARAASDQDIGRLIAGAITLFVIGNAIEDFTRDDSKKKATVSKNNTFSNHVHTKKAKNFIRKNRRILPRECFFMLNRGQQRGGVFGAKCLSEFHPRAARLPANCSMTLPVRHGRKAKVYDAACLRSHGYRMARHPN